MAALLEEIEPLKQAALKEFCAAADLAALEQHKAQFLGSHGRFTALMKQLPSAVTLDVRHHAGTCWICRDGADTCGPYVLGETEGAADRPGIDLTPTFDHAYDGSFDIVSFTASPPAAFPEKREAFEAKMQELMRSVAQP